VPSRTAGGKAAFPDHVQVRTQGGTIARYADKSARNRCSPLQGPGRRGLRRSAGLAETRLRAPRRPHVLRHRRSARPPSRRGCAGDAADPAPRAGETPNPNLMSAPMSRAAQEHRPARSAGRVRHRLGNRARVVGGSDRRGPHVSDRRLQGTPGGHPQVCWPIRCCGCGHRGETVADPQMREDLDGGAWLMMCAARTWAVSVPLDGQVCPTPYRDKATEQGQLRPARPHG